MLNADGLTQGQMASLTGLHQNRLSNYKTGKHPPKEYSVFAAFADGLGLPPAARRALGLDASSATAAGLGVPQPRPASVTEISLEYPGTPAQAARERGLVVAGRPGGSGRAGAGADRPGRVD
jgi:transcriptional regulator with XRE-family HTH domain